jgi:hypothetical protein
VFEVYQDFGLLCARKEVRRALLKTGDEDADTHYTLRDILATVARIAGIPLPFRLALVTTSDSITQVCRTVQQELRVLGCDARVFRVERKAERWLRASEEPVQPSAGEPASSSERVTCRTAIETARHAGSSHSRSMNR